MKFFNHLVFYLILFFIFSCSKDKISNSDTLNRKIGKIHTKIREIPDDSIIFYLKDCNLLVTKNFNLLSDTIKAENEFKNGYYHYFVTKKYDSAFYHYNNAVSYSKDSIKRYRETIYFNNLFENYLKQGDALNGINICNQYEKLLMPEKDIKEYKYVYNFKQRAYGYLGDTKKALFFNELYLKNTMKLNNTSNIVRAFTKNIQYKKRLNKNINIYKLFDSLLNLKFVKTNNALLFGLNYEYGISKYYDNDFITAKKYTIKANSYAKSKRSLVSNFTTLFDISIILNNYKEANRYKDSIIKYKDFLNDYGKKYFLEKELKMAFLTSDNLIK